MSTDKTMDNRVNAAKSVLEKDRFCFETLGAQLISIERGRAETRLVVQDKHLNGLGTVQGGAIFTLADLALAAAANSYGYPAVLVNANISYFKAVSTGILSAKATEESLTQKLGTYRVKVISEKNESVALMQATVYRKKEPLM